MDRIRKVFSTPILIKDWPESTELNKRLAEIILQRESQTSAVQRTNIGSWDSKKDFFRWPEPEILSLKERIAASVREITEEATNGSYVPKDAHILAHAWANVARADSYRKIHNHLACTWSGTYYVKSELSKENSRDSGNIEFLDPRLLCRSAELPRSNFGKSIRVTPRPGRLVMFPNWLHHYVNPVEPESIRICVAFNIKLEPRSVKRRQGSMQQLLRKQ